MRREVSTKARGARGARGTRWAIYTRDSIIARTARRTRVSLGAKRSLFSSLIWILGSIIVRADRAALSLWNNRVGAFSCVLTDHVIAQGLSVVTDADQAGLWFPYILVIVPLSI